MTSDPMVERDERTTAVENIAYRWTGNILVFALLLDVMYRAAFYNEAAWDLLALAVFPGLASAIYQARQKALPGKSLMRMAPVLILTAVIAAAVAVIITMTGSM